MTNEKRIGDLTVVAEKYGATWSVRVYGGPVVRTLEAGFESCEHAIAYIRTVSSKNLIQRGF